MGTVPVLKPREVVAVLVGLGFAEVRQRGSHKQLRHADGRDISPSLVRKIARDIGMDAAAFAALR